MGITETIETTDPPKGQPASRPLSLPPEPDLDAVVTEILDDLLWCGRVWEAWQVGTMTEDDFGLAAENEEIRHDVLDTLLKLLAPQRTVIRRLRHQLKTERSGNLGLVATLARRTDQRNELARELQALRSGTEPDPEPLSSWRRIHRCAASGCDAELRTASDMHDHGWEFTYDPKDGSQEWCSIHRPTGPDTIEGLRSQMVELSRELEKEREYAAMASGDVAMLDMVKEALGKVLKDCSESEDPRAYDDFYAFVEMIHSGDWFSEELV